MKVSVGRDSENSLKIVTVSLKSGLLATMPKHQKHNLPHTYYIKYSMQGITQGTLARHQVFL